MAMVLNTNIPSIQAQRALSESRKEMEIAMERLSTGSRINSAGDDAAGLAIVERMTTQINGLGQATRNANDGIALIRTVENALVEVSGMLQRMRVLSVQASNDTNTATERAFADNEVTSLQKEISRISLNTRYNGAQVLNGSFSAKSLQVGTEAGETLSFSIGNVEASKLGAYVVNGLTKAAVLGANGGSNNMPANGVLDKDIRITSSGTVRTIDVETASGSVVADTAKEIAKKINAVAAATQVVATAKSYAILYSLIANPTQASQGAVQARLKFVGATGTRVETAAFTLTSNDVSDAIQKINAVSSSTNVHASNDGNNRVLLEQRNGDDIRVENSSARTDLKMQAVGIDGTTVDGTIQTMGAYAAGGNTDSVVVRGNLKLTSNKDFIVEQLGSANEFFTDGIQSAPLINVGEISVLTRIKASDAMAIIDGAIQTISGMRGELGSLQNRLNYTVSNLLKVTEFTTAARSRIADADFAAETARLAKAQVLQQAGASMLSQANASTETVLQLLRS